MLKSNFKQLTQKDLIKINGGGNGIFYYLGYGLGRLVGSLFH